MWSEKLKINKQLSVQMDELGYSSPKTIQDLSMTRIAGGQDVIGIGPEGSGKTTTYILSVLMKLKYPFEEAPRALVLVPDKEKVEEVVQQFEELGKNTKIRILGVFGGVGMEPQMDALADGTDVVVGTPDRVRALYLKLGLNMNKIQMFILDDAELLVKQGMQLPVSEMARSLPKCQHLVFAEVMHEKLKKLIDPFLNFPHVIEVNDFLNPEIETYDQFLYHVPNFKTKLNLLNFLLSDKEKFGKVVVFVNSRFNAEKVYVHLRQRLGDGAAWFKPSDFNIEGIDSIQEFKGTADKQVLVIANEAIVSSSSAKEDESDHLSESFLSNDSTLIDEIVAVDYVIHLEIPSDRQIFIDRIERQVDATTSQSPVFLTFATDIELGDVKKIENVIGKKMEQLDLPMGLKIERDIQRYEKPGEEVANKGAGTQGAAFHEKKESNNKQYNYGYKDKLKMAGKLGKKRKS